MVSEIWDLNPISSSESADFFFTKLEDIQMFVSQPGPHELYDELSRVRVTFFLSHKLVAKRLICVSISTRWTS